MKVTFEHVGNGHWEFTSSDLGVAVSVLGRPSLRRDSHDPHLVHVSFPVSRGFLNLEPAGTFEEPAQLPAAEQLAAAATELAAAAKALMDALAFRVEVK